MNIKENGNIFIILAVVIWSLSGLLIKSVEADALWITFIRSLAGGIALSPYMLQEKIYPTRHSILSGIFMAIFLVSMAFTTKISSAAMAISMQYTAPIYMIVYNVYKNKYISTTKLLILLCIVSGSILNILGSLDGSSKVVIVSGLLTGFSFLLYSIQLKKTQQGNPLALLAFVNLIAAAFCAFLLAIHYTEPPKSIIDLSVLILSGVVISGLSYSYYLKGLRKIPMERALIICLLEPVLNPIWVFLGKGERPPKIVILGIVFILLGTLIDIVLGKKNTKEEGSF